MRKIKEYIFMIGMFLVSMFITVTVAGYLTALMGEYLLKRIMELEIREYQWRWLNKGGNNNATKREDHRGYNG